MRPIVKQIGDEQLKKDVPQFKVGDTIKVHTKVVEGEKERIQVFQGIVIARRGSGIQSSFTVRRISYGEGVERVFPIHSPRIDKIEVEVHGKVRRSKLYYLRGRQGKRATKVKEASAPGTANRRSPIANGQSSPADSQAPTADSQAPAADSQ
jgi:large subunit ribosomal protein L19